MNFTSFPQIHPVLPREAFAFASTHAMWPNGPQAETPWHSKEHDFREVVDPVLRRHVAADVACR